MDKALAIWNYVQARSSEPSSHAAISSMFGLIGLNFDAGVVHDVFITLGLFFGAVGVVVKEAKRPT